MAKNTLFGRSLFGYSKEDVNQYILKQNHRIRELSEALDSLEEQFEAHRRFYETLMRVYEENLTVLREVQIRASQNEDRVRTLSEVFGALSEAYRSLYQVALEQQAALSTAKVYENKAMKYDDLALRMKELVLPASMQTASEPFVALPAVSPLPDAAVLDDFVNRADGALREMLADARSFYLASARLQNPTPPEADSQSAG